MICVKRVFTVSLVALVVAGAGGAAAWAEGIASLAYVDRVLAAAKTDVFANIPIVNNATLTIQKNGTSVGTFTANSSENKTINITVPTGALASKSTISNADIAANADIAQSKIAGLTNTLEGKQDKSNMVTSTTDVTTDADSTVKYPSMAAAYAIAELSAGTAIDKVAEEESARESADTSLQQQITTNKGSIDTITTSLGNKQDKSTAVKFGGTAAVGSATVPVYVAADGTVTAITSYAGKAATAGTADKATADGAGNNIVSTYATKTGLSAVETKADGAATAAANAKTAADNAQTTADAKQDKLTAGNNITITAADGKTTISATNTTYTTGTASVSGLTKLYTAAGTNTDGTMTQKAIGETYATKTQLNALDGVYNGTGPVVVDVTQTDGKVTVTKGNVKIPVGSATGETYAEIWFE